ncbi:uncharacterized protein I303_104431 [Kwoniella dejecticola CBS 10117]|uniref:BZIP domain-containing protein n=1 Tax=Kwoniella dejecticola CBS 10117 TaxID=1296121 RepID=A0A1A6A5B8_9TREE|nr:uncharacterized protein I303_04590 [Kwoniella dejecticola CBS 10117]OBR85257.1 hypothetical protein I303_04590 [Kwoniella dejecticola CBS 10117]
MDSVLSPNTSAFLNYLNTFTSDDTTKTTPANPTSFPPSAFFNSMPVPGRDTPEDTPPSAEEASVSPEQQEEALSASDDSDEEPQSSKKNRRASGTGVNKRKVGQNHRKASVDEEEDDESDSDEVTGHEDKKVHNNKSETKKKGGRKSNAGEDGKKEPNKAARRKEQNRAAQKAFRERREAKVKILEEQVAQLEAKSYGASVENENLRGILKRLQEENISLKQSAFTFSMPVSGNGNNGSGDSNGTSPSNIPRPQTAKPPTPPLSSVDDSLTSINDAPASSRNHNNRMVDSPESLVSMNSSTGNTTDNSQSQQPDLMQSNAFNAFLFGNNNNNNIIANNANRPNANPVQSRSSTSSEQMQSFGTQSSSSIATPSPTNQSDINALWASLYPQGVEALLSNQAQNNNTNNNQQPIGINGNFNVNNINPTPFTMLNSQPDFMSFANFGEPSQTQSFSQQPQQTSFIQQTQPVQQQQQQQQQVQPQTQPAQAAQFGNNQFDFNKFAFRDPSNEVSAVTDSMNNWNDITDNSVNDFLASLTGAGNLDADLNNAGVDQDDAFNAQLQQIFGGTSPSQLFNLAGTGQQSGNVNGMSNPFSPTNYLNMSPSPLQFNSDNQSPAGQSPQSTTSNNDGKSSNYSSPQSVGGSSSTSVSASGAPIEACLRTSTSSLSPSANGCISTFGPPKTASEIVHVVDPQGNVVKPSDLWLRFGMQHNHVVDHLMIDDLCDQMRSKATCNEGTGRLELPVKDAEMMFKLDAGEDHKARIEKMKSRVTSG